MDKINFLTIALIFLCPLVFANNSDTPKPHLYTPLADTLIEGSYRLDAAVSIFTTSGYYDEQGVEVPLTGNNSFQKTDFDFQGDYGISDNLQLGLGLRFRQNESTLLSNNTTNSGLEAYWGNAVYRFYHKPQISASFFAEYVSSPYENKNYINSSLISQNDLVLGDGGTEYSFGGLATYKRVLGHYLNGLFGYRAPGNELSSEVIYRIDSVWTWTKWAVGIGLEGVYSLKNDQYSGVASTKPVQATGATTLFNSTDRQYVDPLIDIYYAFDTWRVGVHGKMRMGGQNIDKGNTMGLSLTYLSSQDKKKTAKKLDSFKEYNIEASIVKVSPRGKFIQIDKGVSQDIVKGMIFDIYETDYFGKNILVAEAFVYEISIKKAILKITKKIKNTKVKKGFTARGKQGL